MKNTHHSPVIGITGYKNSGKTTLLEKIIRELTKRQYKIATIKHAHHNFDIDHENRDSYKHRKAGANQILITSRKRWALIHEIDETEEELSFSTAIEKISPCDLILVEGFKNMPYPKIKLHGGNSPKNIPGNTHDPNIIAHIYPDEQQHTKQPAFHRDDICDITDFICGYTKTEEKK